MADKEKTINIPEVQLKEILEQNRKLTQRIGDVEEKLLQKERPSIVPTSVSDRLVTVLFIDGHAVVGFANRGTASRPLEVYSKPDPNNPREQLLYVDLILDGVEEPLTTNFNDFKNEAEKIDCRVVKFEDKVSFEKQGVISKKDLPEGQYRPVETGESVEMVVTSKHRTYVVALPDGREVTIDERYLNISK